MNDELKASVESFLRAEVADVLGIDGSGISVLDVQDGIAQVRLGDACASCPASMMTVMMGLEQHVRGRFPDIQFLEVLP